MAAMRLILVHINSYLADGQSAGQQHMVATKAETSASLQQQQPVTPSCINTPKDSITKQEVAQTTGHLPQAVQKEEGVYCPGS